MIKKRSPLLAGILSLLAPGLGHLYAGDANKGLTLVGIEYGVIILSGIAGIHSTFYGIAAFILFAVGFYIYVITSSAWLAHRNKQYLVKPYNRWYWYLALFVALTIFSNALYSFRGIVLGYETYRIPGKSMEPTLQIGDYITVDTRYSQPKVGDVIVFLYPKNRTIPFVKRVAALGNDTVSIVNGIVIRNGETVIELSVPERMRQSEFSISMKERHIPENEIFLLGDWRDNSQDSRLWGTVPVTDIVGKVTYIWYSKDASRIGMMVK